MMRPVVVSWITIVSAFFTICYSQSLDQSREFLQTLLQKYDRRLRPSINQSEPTSVNVSMTILNIDDFDEVNSKFSVTAFLLVTWVDECITWNSDANHGISSLLFPLSDVWYPILVLGYFHDKLEDAVNEWMSVRIFHDGYALLSPGGVFKSICRADITYYPFDVQNCSLMFVTYGYWDNEIKLQTPTEYVSDEYFVEHGEWEIIANSSVAGAPIQTCVTFTFILRRKPLFFVVNIIFPIVVMSLLNILVFALPPLSGERISYSITVLLAIAVFLTMVGDNLPKTSKPMSLLSFFLMTNLTLSALMCVFAIISLRIYTTEHPGPLPAFANFVVRITSCSRHRKQSIKSIKQDGQEYVNEPENCEPKSKHREDMLNETTYNGEVYSWVDVSKSCDKVCMLVFLFLTIMNSVGYMLLVTKN